MVYHGKKQQEYFSSSQELAPRRPVHGCNMVANVEQVVNGVSEAGNHGLHGWSTAVRFDWKQCCCMAWSFGKFLLISFHGQSFEKGYHIASNAVGPTHDAAVSLVCGKTCALCLDASLDVVHGGTLRRQTGLPSLPRSVCRRPAAAKIAPAGRACGCRV